MKILCSKNIFFVIFVNPLLKDKFSATGDGAIVIVQNKIIMLFTRGFSSKRPKNLYQVYFFGKKYLNHDPFLKFKPR